MQMVKGGLQGGRKKKKNVVYRKFTELEVFMHFPKGLLVALKEKKSYLNSIN